MSETSDDGTGEQPPDAAGEESEDVETLRQRVEEKYDLGAIERYLEIARRM